MKRLTWKQSGFCCNENCDGFGIEKTQGGHIHTENVIQPEKRGENWRRGYQAGYEEGRKVNNQLPMGVSQWREHGKKFGYWEYFEEQIRKLEK